MDRFTTEKLHLNPRSDDELHTAISNFEQKWEAKARHAASVRTSQR